VLPLKVGAARAARAIIAGGMQSAGEWEQAGLVEVMAAGTSLVDAARSWFRSWLAGQSAVALSHAARAARQHVRREVERRLPAMERQYLDELLATGDAGEGVQAWLDKRPPRWEDR
jgi:cyclohexa-1,5-dienecarbonyl-CoA hydratase